MNHLEFHPHAFINENSIVVSVAVFDESAHDTNLIENVRIANGWKQAVCCCTFGLGNVGDTWTGTEFQTVSYNKGWIWDSHTKTWKPPTPMPEDGPLYRWDNDTENWIEIPANG